MSKQDNTKSITCKNCKTVYEGNYCNSCGQSTYEYQKPFKLLIVDLVGNVFAFDTRFWKSLKSLIFSPGTFTREFIHGKRARYTPPFRFYIFISFIFFLLLSIFLKNNVEVSSKLRTEINNSISFSNDSINSTEEDKSTPFYLNSKPVSKEKIKNIIRMVSDNPSMYMNTVLKFFSWSLFLLMPVYGFYLFLFNFKKEKYYYSHLILAINQHSTIFIILTLVLLPKLLFPEKELHIENYLLLLIPIYFYIGNKRMYQQSWKGTFFRLFGIFSLYSLTLLMSFVSTLVIWVNMEFL